MRAPTPEVEAWEVLRELSRQVDTVLGNKLECLTVFGSLANGDYVPEFSDIDQVIVVRSGPDWRQSAKAATEVVQRVNASHSDLRRSLHEGYVVPRDGTWSRNLDQEDGLVLRDVRDLILHGKTLVGESVWTGVQGPTDDELREAQVYGVFWIPNQPPGFHATLNCIFSVAGALYFCRTGRMTWTKTELVRAYGARSDLPSQGLVAEAGRCRREGDLSGEREQAAFKSILPRYEAFLATAREWLTQSGMNRFRSLRTNMPGIVCLSGALGEVGR